MDQQTGEKMVLVFCMGDPKNLIAGSVEWAASRGFDHYAGIARFELPDGDETEVLVFDKAKL